MLNELAFQSTWLNIAISRLARRFFFFVPTTCDEIKDKIGERRAPFSSVRREESAWRCDLLTWLQDYRLQLSRWWRPSALPVFLLLSCGGVARGARWGRLTSSCFRLQLVPPGFRSVDPGCVPDPERSNRPDGSGSAITPLRGSHDLMRSRVAVFSPAPDKSPRYSPFHRSCELNLD